LSKEGFDFLEVMKQIPSKGLYSQWLPIPEELDDNQVREFCLSTWGTKWDTYSVDCDVDGDTMAAYFDSPWGPPKYWLEYMVQMGFDVRGAFWEPGMALGGVFEVLHLQVSDDLVIISLDWNVDDCVERGSAMWIRLCEYGLITDEDQMIDD
jgi:hypothetical protein